MEGHPTQIRRGILESSRCTSLANDYSLIANLYPCVLRLGMRVSSSLRTQSAALVIFQCALCPRSYSAQRYEDVCLATACGPCVRLMAVGHSKSGDRSACAVFEPPLDVAVGCLQPLGNRARCVGVHEIGL